MTHIRIVIDDEVQFDASVGEWVKHPPDMFKDMIKPNARPEPWLKAIMLETAAAIQQKRSVNLDATTDVDGWALKVRYR